MKTEKQLTIKVEEGNHWINLQRITYVIPNKELTDYNTGVLLYYIANALAKSAGNRKEFDFVGVLYCEKINISNDEFIRITLINNQLDFTEIFNSEHRTSINILGEKDLQKRQRIIQLKQKEQSDFYSEWHINGVVDFFYDKYLPLRIAFNRPSRKITIETIEYIDVKPIDFPNKCNTTSEFLTLLTMTTNLPMLFIDKFDWFEKNHNLKKFIASTTENQELQWNNIKINEHDCEKWQYIYPDYDLENGTHHNNEISSEKINLSINELVMGNKFESVDIKNNSGTVTIGDFSSVNITNSFNKVKGLVGEEVASVIKEIADIVALAKSKEAEELFAEFTQKLEEGKPKKSVLKSLWTGLTTLLPQLSTIINIAEKVPVIIDAIGV